MDASGIDIGAIRINSIQYEQWDYHYPKLEAELAGRSKSFFK
jgi:hypothetical protein